nr:hypothetical protein GCM10020063_077260 [Dactylosporangium thailandense]
MKPSRLILATALLAAACGSPSTIAEPPTAYAPDDLVLQVRSSGGMLPVEMLVTQVPEISVYGDGRVITAGPVTEMYPGPALPNVQVRHASPETVRKLAERAVKAGVGNGADLGTPQIMDAGTTIITVRTGTGLVTSDAPALGLGDDGLSAAQHQARKPLVELVRYLRELDLGEPVAFEPSLVAAVGHQWQPREDGLPTDPPPVDWPGAAPLPGDPVGNLNVRCVTADAAPVLAAARSANARTPWVSGGARWEVGLRPLLPHESSCSDVNR